MYTTASPRMRPRRTNSFNSNPDADIDEDENNGENYLSHSHGESAPTFAAGSASDERGGGLGGGLRVPTPHPSLHTRPPRDPVMRQSLTVPGPDPLRRSYIPASEFGYHESRPPTTYQQPLYQSTAPMSRVSHDHSYVDVDENMNIDPNYGTQDPVDVDFSRRASGIPGSTPRPSRLKRFANVFLTPMRLLKSAFRIPKFLRRNRSARRPVTQSSGWDFRDPTPAPPSIRNQYSNEGGERAPENAAMQIPQPLTAPVTMIDIGTGHGPGPAPRSERVPSGGTDSAHGRSPSHHSNTSHHAPSLRSPPLHGQEIKTNGDAVRSSGTRTTHSSRSRNTRTTRTSSSPFSPMRARPSTIKESAPGRSSFAYSSISHCSSLLHQFVRLFRAVRALYHLPWLAAPPRRIAVDFIPALGERSKYCVHRGPPRVPPSVLIAAAAAKNMEPSEGKSWYRPSPQQLEKQLKQGKGISSSHHGHAHAHSHSPRTLANMYQQLFPDEMMHLQRRRSGRMDSLPMYMYPPAAPPFPQPSPYGAHPVYMFPGLPVLPSTNPGAQCAPAAAPTPNGIANSLLTPPAARPPSMSFHLRPASHPVQSNGSTQPSPPPAQTQCPDAVSTNLSRNNSNIQRPPPAAQPMYMLVQAPPLGPHLPPSYGNVYPYPYAPMTPPWTPPSQRV